jgi:two-component system, chemotaxis family, sensor kinase CheA
MDPTEYLPMFLAECREHLQELNIAIIGLEKTPDDAGCIDEIFRAVHSVKGMAGTMGFSAMMQLTHEMEEVFEFVRQRRGGVERDLIDVVLACLDELAVAVDAIERDGEEKLDASLLIPRLRGLVRSASREGVAERAAYVAPPAPSPVADPVVQPSAGYPASFTVRVEFEPDLLMPSVVAYLLLAGLRDRGTVLSSQPAEDELDGWEGGVIEIVCGADFERAEIEAVAAETEGVLELSFAASAGSEESQLGEPPSPPSDEPLATVEPPVTLEPLAPVEEESAVTPVQRRGARMVRVDAERLDQLMHYMGELVVHRTQLASLVEQSDVPGIGQAMQELERTSQALRAMVMKVRMIEVEAVFARLPRLVRDVAGKLGKDVELKVSGADTELDRTVVDALGDPLVHLVRNAIDHGLESAEERIAAGKPASGVLSVSARQAGGGVVITVRDDGQGVDTDAVAERARERGLLASGEELTIEQSMDLLFTPGFSTARKMSDISGRGVGMDAARSAVRALGGDVVIQSEYGRGTVAEIRLPLTLAITSALVVEVAGLPFAIPLDRVEWTLALADHNVRKAAGQELLVLPEGVVPVLDAGRVLAGVSGGEAVHAVIVRAGDELVALAVGELVGQRELVTRPLPAELATSRPLAAGAVLAEGEIALIVDCDALIDAIPKETASAVAA